jgi:hypothetical protein
MVIKSEREPSLFLNGSNSGLLGKKLPLLASNRIVKFVGNNINLRAYDANKNLV